MSDRILVKLTVPSLEVSYEIYLPSSKKIGNIIPLLIRGINDLGDDIEYDENMAIYNRMTGEKYNFDEFVIKTDIVDGTELILI